MNPTPETHAWPLGGALVTAIHDAGETAITLTITAPGFIASNSRAPIRPIAPGTFGAATQM